MRELIKNTYYSAMANPAYLRAVFMIFVVGLVIASTATPLIATDDFADMGQNVEEQSKGIAGAAQMLFYLLGFILVGVGLIMLAIAPHKRGLAVMMLVIGFVLTSIGFFISVGSGSFFGSDVNETDSLLD